MRQRPVAQVRPLWDDLGGVDVGVDHVIVGLDVGEVGGVTEARGLEEVTRIGPEVLELIQLRGVALEVSVIDGSKRASVVNSRTSASVMWSPFDETAVMVDTFRPLDLGEAALAVDDGRYAGSWLQSSATGQQQSNYSIG